MINFIIDSLLYFALGSFIYYSCDSVALIPILFIPIIMDFFIRKKNNELI